MSDYLETSIGETGILYVFSIEGKKCNKFDMARAFDFGCGTIDRRN